MTLRVIFFSAPLLPSVCIRLPSSPRRCIPRG